MNNLREKIEALRPTTANYECRVGYEQALADVLALLNEASPAGEAVTDMKLCPRCQTEPPQLRGGWYSPDNGQWVSCKACDDLAHELEQDAYFDDPLRNDRRC